MKKTMALGLMCAAAAAWGQQMDAREAYQQKQALAEVPRLVQQFDQIQAAQETLAARVSRLENAERPADASADVAALRAELAELRRRQDEMYSKIVTDISKKMATLMAKQTPPPAATPAPQPRQSNPPAPQPPAVTGKYYEHPVEPGQTLSAIATGYGVPIKRIIEANPGIKPNALKIGQKIIVPAE